MEKCDGNKMSRKDFIKKSCAGLLTYGFLKESSSTLLNAQETKKQINIIKNINSYSHLF